MAFNFDAATGSEQTPNRLFKNGVKFAYLRADDKRPITFRLLPAFPEHEGQLSAEEKAGSYVPAVSLYGGRPVIADWIFALRTSRSYQKGAYPILSRKTIVEFNSDGTQVEQEDPLTQVHAYCRQFDKDWGYIVKDIGEWGAKDRKVAKLPFCKAEYVMNVLTLDDDKPGVKVGVVSSGMAIACLISSREGQEGIALRQRDAELTQEQIDANPSIVFAYGDITDPNSAPVFKFGKGDSEDGGRKVYKITLSAATDPATGRKRVERMPLTTDQMAQRVDLAHPETYLNIPTPEEQVAQIVERCCGRNDNGIHEYEMLRAALPDYASLIPEVPSAPGAVNQVQGFTPQAQRPVFQPSAQPAHTHEVKQPLVAKETNATGVKVVEQTPVFRPATQPVRKEPVSKARADWVGGPDPDESSAGQASGPVAGVPGEAFSEDDWVSQFTGKGK